MAENAPPQKSAAGKRAKTKKGRRTINPDDSDSASEWAGSDDEVSKFLAVVATSQLDVPPDCFRAHFQAIQPTTCSPFTAFPLSTRYAPHHPAQEEEYKPVAKPRAPKLASASQRNIPKKPVPKRRKARAGSDDELDDELDGEKDLSAYQHDNPAEVRPSLLQHQSPRMRSRLALGGCHAPTACAPIFYLPPPLVLRRSSSCSGSRSSSSASCTS
jgi:hypothetical protein